MVKIRRGYLEDLEPIARLFDGYRVFYKQQPDPEAARHFIKDRLERNESVIFVAEIDYEIMGFTQLFPLFSSVGMKRTWLLNDLFVDEKARNHGLASKLLNAAKEYGVATSSRWLQLQTSADNYTAQSVYEKNGWKRITDFFYEMPISG
jgi:GNAT superfamily N-acetyltransferase